MSETEVLDAAIVELDRDIEVAERHLEKLRVERLGAVALVARVRRLERTAGGLQASSAGGAAGIGNQAFVETILAESRDGLMLSQIETLAAERGRVLNSDQVRSAVTYLKRKGRADRVSRGKWKLTVPSDSEGPLTGGASESGQAAEPWPLEEGGADASGTAGPHLDTHPRMAGTLHRGDDHGASVEELMEAP